MKSMKSATVNMTCFESFSREKHFFAYRKEILSNSDSVYNMCFLHTATEVSLVKSATASGITRHVPRQYSAMINAISSGIINVAAARYASKSEFLFWMRHLIPSRMRSSILIGVR